MYSDSGKGNGVTLKMELDPGLDLPIWRQIEAGIRRAVAAGRLSPGDAVPSVREAAVGWRVNPATVSRAYRRLVEEGLLVVRRGDGTFVSENIGDRIERLRQQELLEAAAAYIATASELGIGENEIVAAVRGLIDRRESS